MCLQTNLGMRDLHIVNKQVNKEYQLHFPKSSLQLCGFHVLDYRNMASSIEEDNTRRQEEIEELFNYDAGLNDPFSSNYQPAPLPERRDKPVQASIHLSNDLGIDDEIELIRKQRAPRVKLDEKLYEIALLLANIH